MATPLRIFISYSHADDELRRRLRTHLSQLHHDGLVSAWDDRAIPAGAEWADQIDERLESADVILLLVSADFIDSLYCYGKEMTRALERHDDPKDRAIVIPVILRSCDWKSAPFARLQGLPPDVRPLSEWKTEDDYFTAVVKGLRERLAQVPPGSSEQVGTAVSPSPVGLRPEVFQVPGEQPGKRPGGWQRRVRAGLGTLAVLALSAAVWWWVASARVDREIGDGLSLLRLGRYGDARDLLQQTRQRWLVGYRAQPVYEKASLAAMLDETEPDLERFELRLKDLQQHSRNDLDLLLFAGALAQRRPDGFETAIRAYERAIELDPKFAEAYFHLGNALITGGQFAEATNVLTRGLEAVSTAPPLLNARAYARQRLGDFEGAREDYRLSADQGLLLSRIELGELLWRSGDFAGAADQQRQALDALERGGTTRSRGRNVLPWGFEIAPGSFLTLKEPGEKTHYARLSWQATQALLGQEVTPDASYRGAHATDIARAVAASLKRVEPAMSEPAATRARVFAAKLGEAAERVKVP